VNRFTNILLALTVGLLATTLASCRQGDARPVCPAGGKVLYQGKPAEWAQVALVSLDDNNPDKPKPGGQVGADGTFRLSTFASYDGAPPGKYAVLIVYPSPTKKNDNENVGPDLLRGRYANPNTTPFKVEVKEGVNDLGTLEVK
jgi:hypothetical protein